MSATVAETKDHQLLIATRWFQLSLADYKQAATMVSIAYHIPKTRPLETLKLAEPFVQKDENVFCSWSTCILQICNLQLFSGLKNSHGNATYNLTQAHSSENDVYKTTPVIIKNPLLDLSEFQDYEYNNLDYVGI